MVFGWLSFYSSFDAGDTPQPWFVERRPHVDAGQVRGRAPDPVGHRADQLVATVRALQHQRATAVALLEMMENVEILIILLYMGFLHLCN